MQGLPAKLNYIVKLIAAYVVRFKAIIVLGVVIGLLVFSVLRYVIPAVYGKSVTQIGVTGRFYLEDLPESILSKISTGLVAVDENKMVSSAVASSWESQDDGKKWIFTIRDDVYWQDGAEVKAKDISYEFTDVEISTEGDKKIIFNLKEPFSPFPSVLTRPIFKKGLLGVGEWKVSDVSFSNSFIQEMVLVNENKDKLVYKFYPTSERTKTAFKMGHIDRIEEALDPEPLENWNSVNVTGNVNKDQVITIFFNTQDKYLSEKALRQALTYAIKKDPNQERVLGPISPNSWAYNPQVKQYGYDPARFKEIFEGLNEESKKDLNVKLTTSPSLLSVADEIVKNWNEVGVSSSVQVAPTIPSEFQAFLTILDVPKDPDQYSLWHSNIPSNISKFTNLRVDKLLEDGRSELDFEARRKIYLDFQRYLLEELPAAFLYHPVYYTIERK